LENVTFFGFLGKKRNFWAENPESLDLDEKYEFCEKSKF